MHFIAAKFFRSSTETLTQPYHICLPPLQYEEHHIFFIKKYIQAAINGYMMNLEVIFRKPLR